MQIETTWDTTTCLFKWLNFFKKGFIYVYNWVTLLYGRDWHHIVNQLYFNEKKKLKTNKQTNLAIHVRMKIQGNLNFYIYF